MAMGSLEVVIFYSALASPLIHSALASGLRPSARNATPPGSIQLSARTSGLRLAAAAAEVRNGGGAQLGIESTHRLGDAGPAVVVRPARGLPPEPGALGGIAEQA